MEYNSSNKEELKEQKDQLVPDDKGDQMKKESQPTETIKEPPTDVWNFVYFVMLVHGIAILMPWNMFMTANDYYVNFKLSTHYENKTNTTDFSTGATNTTNAPDVLEFYRMFYIQFVVLGAQIPNVLLNFFNLFFRCKGGNISQRIIWSILFIVIVFILTVLLVMVDSSSWSVTFFWITIFTVILINSAVGIYQNSVYGLAASLPMKYTNAILLGSNLSGTITTIIAILSRAFSKDYQTAAIYYFLCAIVILLIAFDCFFLLKYSPFYNFFMNPQAKEVTASMDDVEEETPPFLYIFTKCHKHMLGVFFVFFVTLSVFPSLLLNFKPSEASSEYFGDYFILVFCFLNFNIFATLGSLATEFYIFPSKEYIWIPIICRIVFIPIFILCNCFPETRVIPVLFTSEYIYIIMGILFAFTSGYFSSLSMMYAPKCVEAKYQGTAGMMAAFFLILGIFSGITFSILIQSLITA